MTAYQMLTGATSRVCGYTHLIRKINDEQTATNFFHDIGLLNLNRVKCECGSQAMKKNKTNMKVGFVWVCVNQYCGKVFNPLLNTWFEHSHLSFLQVIVFS